MNQNEPTDLRKPYQKPELVRYGTVLELTRTQGTTSANRDQLGGPPNKTA